MNPNLRTTSLASVSLTMNKMTRTILPITVLAGLVFGITYILSFSGRDAAPKVEHADQGVRVDPLKFNCIVGRQDPSVPHLKYWQDNFEVGEHGHFDFWFRNPNDQQVRVAFTNANCQCAGSEIALIPPPAWTEYVRTSAIAGWPSPGGLMLAAINTALLSSAIEFKDLASDRKIKEGVMVPAASADGPQIGLLRVQWKTKEGEFDRRLTADFVAQMTGAAAYPLHLETQFKVVPPFAIFVPNSSGRTIALGEIAPATVVHREFYVCSRTRPTMDLTITPTVRPEQASCLVVSKPMPIIGADLAEFFKLNPQALGSLSVYKVALEVHERKEIEQQGQKEVKQLDLGLVEFSLQVSSGEGVSLPVTVSGVVRGDIRLVSQQSSDRIDFGNTFSSSESRSTQVTLMADRNDLQLELDQMSCSPDYLDVNLTADKPTNGKNSWTLRVTIPAGKLYGSLNDGFVVLKIKDANSRRFRIPVKASTFDGGPRF